MCAYLTYDTLVLLLYRLISFFIVEYFASSTIVNNTMPRRYVIRARLFPRLNKAVTVLLPTTLLFAFDNIIFMDQSIILSNIYSNFRYSFQYPVLVIYDDTYSLISTVTSIDIGTESAASARPCRIVIQLLTELDRLVQRTTNNDSYLLDIIINKSIG